MKNLSFIFLALLVSVTAPAMGQTNTMTAGTTWESGTWSLGHTPLASEDVVISSGLSVQLSSAASCQNISIGTSSESATTFTVVSGGTLTVSGNLSINPGNQSSTFEFTVGAGMANIGGSVVVSPMGSNSVKVGSGTLNLTNSNPFNWNDGTLTITQSSGQMNFTGHFSLNSGTLQFDQGTTRFNGGFTKSGGTLQSNGNGEEIVIQGDLTANSTLTFDPASTVRFTGTTTITPTSAITFGSFTVDLGGTVTLAGSISLASTSNTEANLTVQSGTLDLASYAADRTTSGGTLTLGSMGVLMVGGSGTLPDNYFTHSIHTNSEVQYSGSSQVAALQSVEKYGVLKITGSNVGSSESFSVEGSLLVESGAQLSSSAGIVAMYAGSSISNSSGTLIFDGLTITGTGTVTNSGDFTVGGNLQVSPGSTFSPSGTATFLEGSSINNSGTLNFAGVSIDDNATVNASGAFSIDGTLAIGTSATFEPSGTVTMKNGSSIDNLGSLTFTGLTIAASASVSGDSFGVEGTLTVNTGGSFSPSGTVTMKNGAAIQTTGTLNFSDLTVSPSATVSSSGSFGVSGALSISTGASFTPTGTVTMTAGSSIANSGSLTFDDLSISGTGTVTGTGNFSIGGTLQIGNSSTFSPSGTLIMLNGSYIQNENLLTLANLTIAGGASVTMNGGASLSGILSVGVTGTLDVQDTLTLVNGSLVTNNGTLTCDNVRIPADAGVNIMGGCRFDESLVVGLDASLDITGTTTFRGGSISNSGSLAVNGLTITNSSSISVNGNVSVGGTFQVNSGSSISWSAGTATMETGSSISNSGSVTFFGLTIQAGASVACVGGFSVSGTLNIGASATFSPSGTVTMLNGSALTGTGSLTFAALSIAASATVTSSSSFSITGNMSIGVAGDFSPSGGVTFSGASSTFQNLGTVTFADLTLNKAAAGILTINNDLVVSGTLTLTAGYISTGGNLVDVTSSNAGAVTASNGVIHGQIRRALANNASTYVFNDASTTITRASGSNPSSVTVQSFPNTFVPYGETGEHAKRYYSIAATGGSGTWTVALSYRRQVGGQDIDERNSLTETGFLVHEGSGSEWSALVGSTQALVANPLRSGKVTATVSGFGEFAFGGLVLLSASTSSIAFGDVGVNLSQSASVTVSNGGSMTLSITSASIDSTAFSVSPSSASVSPGDSAVFSVTFAPSATGAKTGALVFASNASSSPDSVTLSGNGFRPAITSFTPVSSLVGGSVTLSGTFSSTLANNVVRFGGVEGNVTSGSTTQLTVTVPAGATQVPVSVTAAGLSAASPKSFVPVHPETTALSSNTFAPYASFSSITNATQVLASDVDGDGKLDLVYLRPGSSVITFRRNTSSPGSLSESSFAAGVDLAIRANARSMALGDLNGDGRVDLCVTSDSADGSSTGVIMYLNESTSGSIVFTADHGVSITDAPDGVAIGDLDRDGRNDVVVRFMHYATSFQNGLSLLRNTTTGDTLSFSGDQILTSQYQYAPGAVSVRDIDLDGLPELLVTGSNGSGTWYGTINVWKNSSTVGSISMSLWSTLVTQNFHYGTRDVMAVDFDGDEYPDPIMLSSSTVFSYFRNNSGSSFGSRQTLTLTNRSLSGGDLDGDGLAELLVANNTGVSVYPNSSTSGTISFGTRVDLSTGGSTVWSVLADLDADGRMDIASANGGGGVVRTKGLPSEPSTSPSGFSFANVTDTSITIQWSNGNADSTLILLKAGEAVSSGVNDATRYTAHATFGSGTQVGTGNYVVASTGGSTVTIYGLAPSTTYYYAAYSFNGGGDQYLENYLTSSPATGSTSTGAPLPVELVEMSGEYRQQTADVRLSWKTASEVDNVGWEVERREASRLYGVWSRETEAWVKIGFVEGAGTSTSPREYSFTDAILNSEFRILNSRLIYRLKQIDRSGSFSYTHELEVEIGTAPREFTLNQNYPNPFNPSTTISFTVPADGRVTLKVFDLLGREVATLVDANVNAGTVQRALFDASSLPSGMYVARLESGSSSLIRKMLLMK